ncbi:Isocitrate dehydrogenase [NAD] subunit alpha, mitochondrial, partial [Ascosphaera acerosa]
MLASRVFASPARQACTSSFRGTVSVVRRDNIRLTAVVAIAAPAGMRDDARKQELGSDRVAKFPGQKGPDGKYTVTLIEGDGIGPEIAKSVKDIFTEAKVPIKWEPVDVTPILKDGKTTIPEDAIHSVRRNYVALKGPLA